MILFRVAEPCGSWQARTHTGCRAPSSTHCGLPTLPPVPSAPGARQGDPGPVRRVIPGGGRHDRPATDRPTGVAPSLPPDRGGTLLPPSSLPPSQSDPPPHPAGAAGPARNRSSLPPAPHLLDHTHRTTTPAAAGPTGPGTRDRTTTALDHRPRSQNRTTTMAAPISSLRSVCSECGSVYQRESSGSKCSECRPTRERTARRIISESRRGSAKERGYDAAWSRLSRRARRLQPFCSDCGREDQLTTDHSPRAWERRAAGLPVRLEDVDVVCAPCNAERGPARGPDALERPTIADHRRALAELEDRLPDDLLPDDLDERIARGELGPQGE